MGQFVEIEATFSRALLDASQPVPAAIRGAGRRRADRRFAVYRNNVIAGLIQALAQRFPVVHRLVGNEFFDAMARVYVTTCPPASPVMMLYGETFPDFVDGFAPAASVPYLGDIARIEIARGRAYHAEDATPISPQTFATLPAERLANLRINFHASVSIITSFHPIVSIWQVNDDLDHAVPISPWAPEAALIARPFKEVEVRRLAPAVAVFLSSLARRETMTQAITAGMHAAAGFDLVANLRLLMMSNVVTAIECQLEQLSVPGDVLTSRNPRRGRKIQEHPVAGARARFACCKSNCACCRPKQDCINAGGS